MALSKCRTPNFTPHYFNLDIPIDATPQQIKQAYRRLVRVIHPDKIRDKNQRANAFVATQLVNEAYEVLTDSTKRSIHRNGLRFRKELTWEIKYWEKKWQERHRYVSLVTSQNEQWISTRIPSILTI